MSKLIKSGQLEQNLWQILENDGNLNEVCEGQWLVPIEVYEKLSQEALFDPKRIGLWVTGEQELDPIKPFVAKASVLAIRFPVFTDGRGFSLARMLREHVDYKGELRAIGNYIQDQLFYLYRCGFDAFEIADDADAASCLQSLKDFTDSYQAAVDEPQPLFRRRA